MHKHCENGILPFAICIASYSCVYTIRTCPFKISIESSKWKARTSWKCLFFQLEGLAHNNHKKICYPLAYEFCLCIITSSLCNFGEKNEEKHKGARPLRRIEKRNKDQCSCSRKSLYLNEAELRFPRFFSQLVVSFRYFGIFNRMDKIKPARGRSKILLFVSLRLFLASICLSSLRIAAPCFLLSGWPA